MTDRLSSQPAPNAELPRYIDAKKFREVLCLPDRTFRRRLSVGKIPKPDLRIGRAMRWRTTTVQEFLDNLEAKS